MSVCELFSLLVVQYYINVQQTHFKMCNGEFYICLTVFALGVKKTGSWDPIGLKKRGPQNKNGVPT